MALFCSTRELARPTRLITCANISVSPTLSCAKLSAMSKLSRALRVAVIGAGPSGFYVTESLLKQTQYAVSVDLLDRLPTPYGLVRYGVAPDHPKIKSIALQYEKIASDPRVRFLGHVELGKDLS